jgi:hypothetical protein
MQFAKIKNYISHPQHFNDFSGKYFAKHLEMSYFFCNFAVPNFLGLVFRDWK